MPRGMVLLAALLLLILIGIAGGGGAAPAKRTGSRARAGRLHRRQPGARQGDDPSKRLPDPPHHHRYQGSEGTGRPAGRPLREARLHCGVLPNTPDNLLAWIKDPPGIDPLTAMPASGLDEAEARDVAAYLYTLD